MGGANAFSKYLVYEVRFNHPHLTNKELAQYLWDDRQLKVSPETIRSYRMGRRGGKLEKRDGPNGRAKIERQVKSVEKDKHMLRRAQLLLWDWIYYERRWQDTGKFDKLPPTKLRFRRPGDPKSWPRGPDGRLAKAVSVVVPPDGGRPDAGQAGGVPERPEVRQQPQHAPRQHPDAPHQLVDRPRGA